jgi:hypothetical protein
MDLLLIDSHAKTAGLTQGSLNVILASITVTSMAPGELARKVKGTSVSLKAGDAAISGWEEARNEAKRRLWEVFDRLGDDERAFVMNHARDFLDSTQQGIKGTRALSLERPSTPRRDPDVVIAGHVSGGGYAKTPTLQLASKIAPLHDSEAVGAYITEPFRRQRQAGP